MNGMDSAKRVFNGTYGELWLDGELVAECYGAQFKVAVTKKDIQIPGKMMTDTKLVSAKGTGTIKRYKTNSRMAILLADKIKKGEDVRFVCISKLDDPDAYGAERIAVRGVSFDDLILADWEAGNEGKVDSPCTFSDFELMDSVS